MLPVRRRARVHQLTIVAAAAAVGFAMLMAGSATALAAYGPPPPVPTPVPGGFSDVVTSVTVGPAGMFIRHLDLDGLNASLRIQPGTFLQPVQVTVTEPFVRDGLTTTAYLGQHRTCGNGAGIGDAGFPGYCAISGTGILVQINGVNYAGPYLKPMILRIRWKRKLSTQIVVWDGQRFVKAPHTRDRRHFARIEVSANSDFAVLIRVRRGGQPALLAAGRSGLAARWLQALSTSGVPLLP
jgi:hypothetical protein